MDMISTGWPTDPDLPVMELPAPRPLAPLTPAERVAVGEVLAVAGFDMPDGFLESTEARRVAGILAEPGEVETARLEVAIVDFAERTWAEARGAKR